MITSTYLSPLFQDRGFVYAARLEFLGKTSYQAVYEKVLRDAKASGRSFREQAELEKSRLPGSGEEGVLANVSGQMRKFYFSENGILRRLLRSQANEAKFDGSLGRALPRVNSALRWMLLLLGAFAFCGPPFPQEDGYLLPLSLKALAVLLTIQPILLSAHERYYVALIPVLAFMVLSLERATPRALWEKYRKPSRHKGLVIAAQALTVLYCSVNAWLFLYR